MRINKKLIKNSNINSVKKENKIIFNNYKNNLIQGQKNIITCDFIGRLGNNLFQMAAILDLGRRNDASVKFPRWVCDGKNYDAEKIFAEKFDFYRDNYHCAWNDYNYEAAPYVPIPYQKNINIRGFFQSYKYFYEGFIQSMFAPNQNLVKYIYDKYSHYLNKKCSSIHVRRGDYLQSNGFNLLSMKYYKKAMEIVRHQTDIFLVFSDDIPWCKENFKNIDNVYFIEGEQDYVDLYFMSLCKNNIIACSSFSWWGAYLNKNANKIIVSADSFEWFSENNISYKLTYDMCPNDWIQIDPKLL